MISYFILIKRNILFKLKVRQTVNGVPQEIVMSEEMQSHPISAGELFILYLSNKVLIFFFFLHMIDNDYTLFSRIFLGTMHDKL